MGVTSRVTPPVLADEVFGVNGHWLYCTMSVLFIGEALSRGVLYSFLFIINLVEANASSHLLIL